MPAYVIVELTVTDAERYEDYKAAAQATIAAHGGRYLVRGGRVESIEGPEVTDRLVVVEFPDSASARRWYESPEYQRAVAIRLGSSTTTRIVIAEGHDPGE